MTKSKKSSNLMTYAGTLGALIILGVVLTIASPNFLTFNNMMSILRQSSFNALVSIGMLVCLITAGIDLSVGANATFCVSLSPLFFIIIYESAKRHLRGDTCGIEKG